MIIGQLDNALGQFIPRCAAGCEFGRTLDRQAHEVGVEQEIERIAPRGFGLEYAFDPEARGCPGEPQMRHRVAVEVEGIVASRRWGRNSQIVREEIQRAVASRAQPHNMRPERDRTIVGVIRRMDDAKSHA
jgi:hypothetical protein